MVIDTPSTLWDDVQPESSRRLLMVALDAFSAQGFHATTTRDIAQRASMSPAAVYVHYRSKADLLLAISRTGHEAVLRTSQDAIGDATEPPERLRRFVQAFATWHARNHTVARVIQYELGALPEQGYTEIRELRRRFRDIVGAELRHGLDAGCFEVSDLPGTTRAVLSLCIDVARWYDPKRDTPAEQLGDLYADLVLRMVGSRPA